MSLPGLTADEFDAVLLSVGSHQSSRPLSPVEVSRCFQRSRESGATLKEIASAVGFGGATMVGRFLRLLTLAPDILHLVNFGESKVSVVAFSTASEIVSAPIDVQSSLAQAVCKFGLTKTETRSVIQLIERSGRTFRECLNDVVMRRPVVIERQLVVGVITETAVADHLASLRQVRRDELLLEVLQELYGDLGSVTAKLGPLRFTVIGGRSVAETIGRDAEFEATIIRRLSSRVRDEC